MRLFLDANILFSAAHNPQGNARALFALAYTGLVDLDSSAFACDEAARNIAVKFPELRQSLADLLEQVRRVREPPARIVARAMTLGLPNKDAPILAAAVAAEVDALVTGDKRHFGAFYGQRVEGVLVLPPLEALVLVLERRGSAD